MTTPSPAPWTAHGFAIYSGETLVAQVPVAEFSDDPYERKHALPEGEAKFNPRLISKAPELVAMLVSVTDALADIVNASGGTEPYDSDEMAELFAPIANDSRSLLAALAAEED